MKEMIMLPLKDLEKGSIILVSNSSLKSDGFKVRMLSHYDVEEDTIFCFENHNEIKEYIFAYPLKGNEHLLSIDKVITLGV